MLTAPNSGAPLVNLINEGRERRAPYEETLTALNKGEAPLIRTDDGFGLGMSTSSLLCIPFTDILSDFLCNSAKRASCPPTFRHSPANSADTTRTLVDSSPDGSMRQIDFGVRPKRPLNPWTANIGADGSYAKAIPNAEDVGELKSVVIEIQDKHEACLAKLKQNHYQEVEQLKREVLAALDAAQENIDNLKTRLFTAETTVSARDVGIANLEDDHEAEISELREEKAKVSSDLQQQGRELSLAIQRKDFFEEGVSKASREHKALEYKVAERDALIKDMVIQGMAAHTKIAKQDEALGEASGKIEAMEHDLEIVRSQNFGLQLDLKQAALEVGFFAAQNAEYRAVMEDEDRDPARTAHFDGLLHGKDAKIIELEEEIVAANAALRDERSQRLKEMALSKREVEDLQTEFNHVAAAEEALSESRGNLQARTSAFEDMFKGKIYHDDMVKAICNSHDAIIQDNASLLAIVRKRDLLVLVAKEETALIEAEKVKLNNELDNEKVRQRELEPKVGVLEEKNDRLQWMVEMQPGIIEHAAKGREAKMQESEQEVQRLRQQMDNLIHDKSDFAFQRLMNSKDNEIKRLGLQLEKSHSINDQLHDVTTAQLKQWWGCDFDFVNGFMNREIRDWHSEDIKRRLRYAEGRIAEQETKRAQDFGKHGPLAAWMGTKWNVAEE